LVNPYFNIINSPKLTMITLANAISQPNTVVIKLKNTFVTIMTMLCPWRLHNGHQQN